MVFANFQKIDVFEKTTKILDFRSIFGGQNHKKSRKNYVEKYMFFLICFFGVFFCDFLKFWLNFGLPGPSKNLKKSKKDEFLTCSVLKDGSERVQGRFGNDFLMVLD